MKRSIVAMGVVLGFVLLVLGCEGESHALSSEPADPILHFDTDGAYDLSEYLFPDKNQTNMYEKTVYINSEGKRVYPALDGNRTFYHLKYTRDANKVEELFGVNLNRRLQMAYHIEEMQIIETDANDENMTVVRFVDKDEMFLQHSSVVNDNGNEEKTSRTCKVAQYLEQREGYTDVLLVSCELSENYEMTFKDKKGETRKQGTLYVYFSKHIGMIESSQDLCEDTYFSGTLVESECVKTDTVITQITD